jgi:hypothetical protein
MPDDVQPVNPTYGYGPRESSDDTRQAQQTVSNDAPTDVNLNAVIGRVQAGTFSLMAANFEANADRRNKLFDAMATKGP